LGRCSAFDELVENSGLWKLETVGDAYIAAGGLFSGGSHDGGPSATYDSKLVLRSNLDATFKAASKMLVSVCTTILRFLCVLRVLDHRMYCASSANALASTYICGSESMSELLRTESLAHLVPDSVSDSCWQCLCHPRRYCCDLSRDLWCRHIG